MSRLERWSRLKRNVPVQEEAPPAGAPDEKASVESDAAGNEAEQSQHTAETPQALQREPEPGSLDHTLPDPDTLGAGSDFSAFMAPGVSGPLRRQALKRLWATGNYNVRDGLDDYDADYNQTLKPMVSELASKLRRWTHKAEEVADTPVDDNEPGSQPQEERPESEQINAEKELLDDQSDYLSDTQTKR
jgi:hypothetical protein